jgi:hypothetical protein
MMGTVIEEIAQVRMRVEAAEIRLANLHQDLFRLCHFPLDQEMPRAVLPKHELSGDFHIDKLLVPNPPSPQCPSSFAFMAYFLPSGCSEETLKENRHLI